MVSVMPQITPISFVRGMCCAAGWHLELLQRRVRNSIRAAGFDLSSRGLDSPPLLHVIHSFSPSPMAYTSKVYQPSGLSRVHSTSACTAPKVHTAANHTASVHFQGIATFFTVCSFYVGVFGWCCFFLFFAFAACPHCHESHWEDRSISHG